METYGNWTVSYTLKIFLNAKIFNLNIHGIQGINLHKPMKEMYTILETINFFPLLFGILDRYYSTYFSLFTNWAIMNYWSASKAKSLLYKTSKSKKQTYFQKNLKISWHICFIMIQNQEWSYKKFFQMNFFPDKWHYCLNKNIRIVSQGRQSKYLQEEDLLWVQPCFQNKKDKKEVKFYQSTKWLKAP